jgi:Flp pilus assembly protein TadD
MSPGWLAILLAILVAPHYASAAIVAMQEKATAPGAAPAGPPPGANKQAALEAQRNAEADPSESNLFLYASSLMKLDYPSAETIYRYALKKYPDSVRLHAGLASALWAQAKRDEGAAELYHAYEIAPADPHPLEFLVSAGYIPDTLRQKVVDGLQQLRRRYPRDGLILFDLEMVLSNRYNGGLEIPADFVPTVKEAIRLTPQLPEAYFQLSLVYEAKADYAEQAQALRHAVELSPQDEHYRYNLAMAYKRLGNKDEFQKEMSIFQQMHSRSSQANP